MATNKGKKAESRAHPPEPLSRPKKLLFAVATTVAFFIGLEIVLAVCGITTVATTTDPFVGFAGHFPLFVTGDGADPPQMVTAEGKLPYFNRQRFSARKPGETVRIFALGGSTTFGRPYDDRTSFCGWLRQLLPAVDSSRHWEVVNAGGISYASYRVVRLVRELVAYEPDVFVIYTGHNEFLERRTYRDILLRPSSLRAAHAVISRSRTYAGLTRLLPWAGEPAARSGEGTVLPGEVEAVLDDVVGLDHYHREELQPEAVLEHFAYNLRRMIELARAAGAEVILVGPAANLRDCAPFKSQHRDGLTAAEASRFERLMGIGQRARQNERPEEAILHFDQALGLDDRHAQALYRRGLALYEIGDYAQAEAALLQAVEEDVCPLRAIAAITGAVAETGRELGVPVVDFAALVRDRSPNGIAGAESFLDHVHPTIEVHRLLALSLLDALGNLVGVEVARDRRARAVEAVRVRVEEGVDDRLHGIARRNLAKVLAWAGKHDQALRHAKQALVYLPDDVETRFQAGLSAAALGLGDEAVAHYRAALEIEPTDLKARMNLAGELVRAGRLDQATSHVEQVLGAEPDHARAHHNLGHILQARGDVDGARASYRRALELDPLLAEAANDLGAICERQGDSEGAESLYRRAVASDPRCATALYNLGLLELRQARAEAAVEHLAGAVEANPDRPAYHFSLAGACRRLGQERRAVEHLRWAVELKPEFSRAIDELAWMLATSADPSLRDGGEALRLALSAADLTDHANPLVLDTLAVALAERGDFVSAERVATQAAAGLRAVGYVEMATAVDQRVDSYRRGQPWRGPRADDGDR